MGGKKGRNHLKFSLSSSYDETEYYLEEELEMATPKNENQKT